MFLCGNSHWSSFAYGIQKMWSNERWPEALESESRWLPRTGKAMYVCVDFILKNYYATVGCLVVTPPHHHTQHNTLPLPHLTQLHDHTQPHTTAPTQPLRFFFVCHAYQVDEWTIYIGPAAWYVDRTQSVSYTTDQDLYVDNELCGCILGFGREQNTNVRFCCFVLLQHEKQQVYIL